jgi:hypothetical protein
MSYYYPIKIMMTNSYWEWRAANLVISVSIPHDNTNLEESLLAAVLQKYMGANIHGDC